VSAADPRVAAVLEADARRRAALIATDIEALDGLFADEMIHIHSTGREGGKAEYLEDLKTVFEFLEIERPHIKVRFYGDAALLTGPMLHRVRLRATGDVVVVEAFGAQIWSPTDGGWKQVFYQATPLKPAT